MKLRYIFYLVFSGIAFSSFSQNYTITWQRTIGGSNADKLSKMITTSDGGMVLCGYSNSNISGSKMENSLNGSYDFWVVKLGANGITQWAKAYGGTDRDIKPTIIQTSDSGYLVGGSSVSPASGAKTENAINQSFDYWVIKLDKSGNKVWDNTIGGIQTEKLGAVLETSTAYFVCGYSYSTQGYDKTVDNEGSSLWCDYWVIKLNKSGTVLWDSVYGSKNRDALTSAIVTPDGGILLGGSSYSPRGGTKTDDYIGNNDFWIVKLDSLGHEQFDKTIGGSLSDYLTSMDVVGNSGYVFGGYSNSPASFNKTDGCRGATDYWIIRTDKAGNQLWDKTYGGSGQDYLSSIKFDSSKYYVGGFSNSGISGDKTSASKGGMDFWTLILDKNGNLLEQNDWGGAGDDSLVAYIHTGTNQYTLAGSSSSSKSGDKVTNTVGNSGKSDYWVFKIASSSGMAAKTNNDNAIVSDKTEDLNNHLSLNISPNPVKNVLNLNYNGNTKQSASISVYSNSGKLIQQQILSQSSGTNSFDFSTQASGIYYAVLQSGPSSVTKKFVKN